MIKEDVGAHFSDELSFEEIEKRLSEKSTLIIPLGGLEPLGSEVPSGIINQITLNIAKETAIEHNCLSAPLISYGFITPFSSFGGSFSVKRSIMESMIRNIVKESILWGVKKILFINLTTVPSDFFPRLLKCLVKKTGKCKISYFDFQNDKEFRKNILGNNKSDIRLDMALLSMALAKNLINKEKIDVNPNENKDEYSRWRRRGRDPELFRKKFPVGLVASNLDECSAEEGENLFKKITSECYRLISSEGCN